MSIGLDVQNEATRIFNATQRAPTSVHLGREAAAAFVEEMRTFLELTDVPDGLLAHFGDLDVLVDEGAAPDAWRVA